jgi:hypothetical protein
LVGIRVVHEMPDSERRKTDSAANHALSGIWLTSPGGDPIKELTMGEMATFISGKELRTSDGGIGRFDDAQGNYIEVTTRDPNR